MRQREDGMRALMINTVAGIGSTGSICTALAAALAGRGDEARIAYGRAASPAAAPISYRIGSRAGIALHGVGARLFDNAGFSSARATARLVDMIRDYAPDVIHLHNLHGYYLHVGVLFDYLREAGIPVVWTLHDCWAFTGHCAHFDYVACDRYKAQCGSCPAKRSYPASLFLDGSRRNHANKKAAFSGVPSLTVVTPSHWLADRVSESFLSEYPTEILPNGIDLGVFRPTPSSFRKKHGLQDKTVLLGVAFEWSTRKGLDVFAELSHRLDDRYRIVLVGVDEQTRRTLPDGILALGRTGSAAELAEIYTAADLFVNPTREETLGLVNLEALACGTPGVTFAAGGSPECYDEASGSTVAVDDIDALEGEIRRITEMHPYTPEACIARASAFDRETFLSRYLALYDRILQNDRH